MLGVVFTRRASGIDMNAVGSSLSADMSGHDMSIPNPQIAITRKAN